MPKIALKKIIAQALVASKALRDAMKDEGGTELVPLLDALINGLSVCSASDRRFALHTQGQIATMQGCHRTRIADVLPLAAPVYFDGHKKLYHRSCLKPAARPLRRKYGLHLNAPTCASEAPLIEQKGTHSKTRVS